MVEVPGIWYTLEVSKRRFFDEFGFSFIFFISKSCKYFASDLTVEAVFCTVKWFYYSLIQYIKNTTVKCYKLLRPRWIIWIWWMLFSFFHQFIIKPWHSCTECGHVGFSFTLWDIGWCYWKAKCTGSARPVWPLVFLLPLLNSKRGRGVVSTLCVVPIEVLFSTDQYSHNTLVRHSTFKKKMFACCVGADPDCRCGAQKSQTAFVKVLVSHGFCDLHYVH